jgi:hypothetical protein
VLYLQKRYWSEQSLVDLVVIDAEFSREDYGSIPHNYNREEIEIT